MKEKFTLRQIADEGAAAGTTGGEMFPRVEFVRLIRTLRLRAPQQDDGALARRGISPAETKPLGNVSTGPNSDRKLPFRAPG